VVELVELGGWSDGRAVRRLCQREKTQKNAG